MKPWILPERVKHEIVEAYLAGVPVKIIAYRFGVALSYPATLAKRRGVQMRKRKAAHAA